mgnify:CR=1 FL=1
MNIKKVLGIIELDENAIDNLEMFLAERTTEISRIVKHEQSESSREWRALEKQIEGLFKDQESYVAFMDALANYQAQNEEDFYLYGLKDGIKIMKVIMKIE